MTEPDTPNYLQDQHAEDVGQENRIKPTLIPASLIMRLLGKPVLLYKIKRDRTKTRAQGKENYISQTQLFVVDVVSFGAKSQSLPILCIHVVPFPPP